MELVIFIFEITEIGKEGMLVRKNKQEYMPA
jgi:hypothetical protein